MFDCLLEGEISRRLAFAQIFDKSVYPALFYFERKDDSIKIDIMTFCWKQFSSQIFVPFVTFFSTGTNVELIDKM